MIRETSHLSYTELVASGKLGPMQEQVFNMVYLYGPGTANELYHRYLSDNPFAKQDETVQKNLHARLNELRDDFKAVEELPKRRCMITGKMALVWQVGDGSNEIPKRLTKAERIELQVYEFKKCLADEKVPYCHWEPLIAWVRSHLT